MPVRCHAIDRERVAERGHKPGLVATGARGQGLSALIPSSIKVVAASPISPSDALICVTPTAFTSIKKFGGIQYIWF